MRSPSIRGYFSGHRFCPKRRLCPMWSAHIVRDPASRHKTPCQLKPRPVCSPCVRNIPAELCLVGSFDLHSPMGACPCPCLQRRLQFVFGQPKSLSNACDSVPKAGCLVVTVSDGYQSSSNDISGERMLRGNVNDMRDRPIRFKLPPLTCPALMPAARS